MRKIWSFMLAILLSVSLGAVPGTAEQADCVRNAAQVCWAGGDFAAVKAGEDEPAKLVRLSDGQTVLEQVDHICSTGGYACAETPEGTWLISADGTAVPLGKDFAGGSESYPVMGRYGLFFGSSEGQMCVFDPEAGTYTFLPDVYDSFWHDIELYRDGDGTVFAVLSDGQIFRADGKTVLKKGKYDFVRNCDYGYITNGYVCANDEKGAAVISVSTGEEVARFDGYYWLRYDGECMIYPDNTASIGGEMEDGYINGYPTRIVGLDGAVLKDLPDAQFFEERFAQSTPAPVYRIAVTDGQYGGGYYNVLTDRTYMYTEAGESAYTVESVTCPETGMDYSYDQVWENYVCDQTGETFADLDELINDGEAVPERAEKYRPVNERVPWVERTEKGYQMVCAPDGRILGSRYWKDLPWYWEKSIEGISGRYPFDGRKACAVKGMNGLCGVIDLEGRMIVPAEYDEVQYLSSFSADPREDGFCIAACRDGQWYLFSSEGEMR
uniref:WG repeat-containing protein n=1 Tax=uncultured bacterium Contig203 TaxID=1393530 RepID=W0FPJ4_9BACT|nr:hypothetical protein [uncultured bacterium Contig203]